MLISPYAYLTAGKVIAAMVIYLMLFLALAVCIKIPSITYALTVVGNAFFEVCTNFIMAVMLLGTFDLAWYLVRLMSK